MATRHPRPDTPGTRRPDLLVVLESAALLQEVFPDAVLVGDSAAALYGDHRVSDVHDHVLNDLAEQYDAVLEAIEATDGCVTNRLTPGKVILGELGGIETGVRQLIRKVPLEVAEVELPSDRPEGIGGFSRQVNRGSGQSPDFHGGCHTLLVA